MIHENHTFVICAYNESPYLRECVESLVSQSVQSRIICTTSTQGSYIADICGEYNIPFIVSSEQKGMAADWNFAYKQAETPYVTIAHQDDVYEPDFLKCTLEYLNKAKKPLIAFTGCYEIRDGVKVMSNMLLKIKRIMSSPWRFRVFGRSRFFTRRIFMFGNPICCPSVTFVKTNLPDEPFNAEFNNNCDWLAWAEFRDLPGEFVYCPEKLMGHRIHGDSETTNRISDNTRNIEDKIMLRMFAPKPVAWLIHRFYVKGQKSNKK